MKEQHLHLYRKYRPQKFSELVGQKHLQTTLKHEVSSGSFSHAYIFCGPRGLGKTSTARILAKALNCEKLKNGEPDLTCNACRAIGEGRFLDLIEMDAASNTGVDHVREHLISAARVAPSQGKVKVFIVDEAHMLSISAFNALLKTLEEPPAGTVIILATTEVHKVPETILSRCERFDFKKIPSEEMVRRLQWIVAEEKRKVDSDVLELIAQRSEGCERDAENVLGQVLSLDEQKITMEVASLILPRSDFASQIALSVNLAEKNLPALFEQIQVLMDEGVDIEVFMSDAIEFWRKLLVLSVHRQVALFASMTKDAIQQKTLQEILNIVSPQDVVQWIEQLLGKRQQFSGTSIGQLPMELACVGICLRKSEPKGPAGRSNFEASASVVSKTIPKVATVVGSAGTDGIKQHWAKILRETRKVNHALMLTLKVATVLKATKEKITLGFRYKFYRDRISDHENKRLLEGIFEQVTGEKMVIECEIDEKLRLPSLETPALQTQHVEAPQTLLQDIKAPESGNVWDMVGNTFGTEFTEKLPS